MRLGVNIDHVATVRQARRGTRPDPVEAALACERAGADSIVCHLREDRRHIQDADVRRLKRVLKTRLNLEMSIAPDVVRAALAIRPWRVTLVPERRQELTTEGGLDAARLTRRLATVVSAFHRRSIEVSVFIDPSAAQIRAAETLGVTVVELHTGRYADAPSVSARIRELRAIREAAALAASRGLEVAAGHGLDYDNTRAIAAISQIEELNIGFSMISRSLFVGLESAVRQMRALMERGRR